MWKFTYFELQKFKPHQMKSIILSTFGAFLILLAACKKEDNNQQANTTNVIVYENETKAVGYTKITKYGRPDSSSNLYEFSIVLADEGIIQLEGDSFVGSGDVVVLSLYSSDLNLPDIGSYDFSDPMDSLNTFYGEFEVDYNTETDQSISTLSLKSGTMEIKSATENTFSIQLNVVLSNDKTLSANYTGVYESDSDIIIR